MDRRIQIEEVEVYIILYLQLDQEEKTKEKFQSSKMYYPQLRQRRIRLALTLEMLRML
jgi:hypothetical protein